MRTQDNACEIVGYITEIPGSKSHPVCQGVDRISHVHLSRTQKLRIDIVIQGDGSTKGRFLLKYECKFKFVSVIFKKYKFSYINNAL